MGNHCNLFYKATVTIILPNMHSKMFTFVRSLYNPDCLSNQFFVPPVGGTSTSACSAPSSSTAGMSWARQAGWHRGVTSDNWARLLQRHKYKILYITIYDRRPFGLTLCQPGFQFNIQTRVNTPFVIENGSFFKSRDKWSKCWAYKTTSIVFIDASHLQQHNIHQSLP